MFRNLVDQLSDYQSSQGGPYASSHQPTGKTCISNQIQLRHRTRLSVTSTKRLMHKRYLSVSLRRLQHDQAI